MPEHDELESSLAAWVLGALDPDEAASLESHLEACASCRETAARLRRIVGMLPLTAEEVKPPDRLRARVLEAAAAPRRDVGSPPSIRRVPTPAPRPRRALISMPARVPVYAAAAAVVLALLLGVAAGALGGRGSTPVQQGQVARFNLSGQKDMASARASVIDLKSDGLALVDFSGLPQLVTGRVYEVWLITPSGRPDPAAVFVPDSNGAKVVLVTKPLNGYSQMAVTSEVGPAGAQAPTQQPELSGRVA